MALFDFIRDAGEKIFGHRTAGATPQAEPANEASAQKIAEHIKKSGFDTSNLNILFDGATDTVSLGGTVVDQVTREKIVLVAGNVQGVAHVDDQMKVQKSGTEAKYYTVKSGDTLSKISKDFYGDASQYNKIFEANRPMLSDPNKIYPGQVLRVPQEQRPAA